MQEIRPAAIVPFFCLIQALPAIGRAIAYEFLACKKYGLLRATLLFLLSNLNYSVRQQRGIFHENRQFELTGRELLSAKFTHWRQGTLHTDPLCSVLIGRFAKPLRPPHHYSPARGHRGASDSGGLY